MAEPDTAVQETQFHVPDLGPTAVQRAGEYLLGDLDRLVEEITAQVWLAVPGYHDILVNREALEQYVRPNINDTLEFMRSGRDIDDQDRSRLDELGRSRALQGISMTAMVQSFRTAERVLVDAFCVFCIQSSVNSAEQRNGIRAITSILDKVESATFESYLATQRQLQTAHASTVAVFLAKLIDGSLDDRVDIDMQARLIGANPAVSYRCVAFSVLTETSTPSPATTLLAGDSTDPAPRLTRLRRHLTGRLMESKIATPIAGVRDDALVLLIPNETADAITVLTRAVAASTYRAPVVAGLGEVDDTLFDARRSARQALAALDIAVRQRTTHRLVSYGDVVLEIMLLRDREASDRLISSYLGPLGEHPQLDETVRIYIELGHSAQTTADRLNVHVNTIAYRLRRIRELTGHDIRDADAAIKFSIALRARALIRD